MAETAIARARPYYIVLYTTFNRGGNDARTTPPRLVMYRLYSIDGIGELWRFQYLDDSGTIETSLCRATPPPPRGRPVRVGRC